MADKRKQAPGGSGGVDGARALLYAQAARLNVLENSIQLLSWDALRPMGEGAAAARMELLEDLGMAAFRLKTDPALGEALARLAEDDDGGGDEAEGPGAAITRAMVDKFRWDYEQLRMVGEDLARALERRIQHCRRRWLRARAENDFFVLRYELEHLFDLQREAAAARGWPDDPLSCMMNDMEPGLTRGDLDRCVKALAPALLSLSDRLRGSRAQPMALSRDSYPAAAQRALLREVLTMLGFDFSRGALASGEGNWTAAVEPRDTRILLRLDEADLMPGLSACLFQGGLGLHSQQVTPMLRGSTLERCGFEALSRCVGRFYETTVGRSLGFWRWCQPRAAAVFPNLAGLDVQALWRSSGRLRPGTDPAAADELSQNLHLLMRYELEKALFDKDLSFDAIPRAWSDLCREYLELRPQDHRGGILTEPDWAMGRVGSAGAAIMGELYAASLGEALDAALPQWEEELAAGKALGLLGWLRQSVLRFGGMEAPAELLERIGAPPPTVARHMARMTARFARIYRF